MSAAGDYSMTIRGRRLSAVNTWHANVDPQTSHSRHCGRRSTRHIQRNIELAHPNIMDDECTESKAEVKCTYICTDSEDDQYDCMSTTEILSTTCEIAPCGMSAKMASEGSSNILDNLSNGTMRDTPWMASWETVETTTEWCFPIIGSKTTANWLQIGIE